MNERYVCDMTKGNEVGLLLRFALPMLVGNIFQQLYNMVDSIIVGKFVGSNALGAVGAVGNLNFLFFSLCLGLASGIGILISQFFGAGKDDYVKKNYCKFCIHYYHIRSCYEYYQFCICKTYFASYEYAG